MLTFGKYKGKSLIDIAWHNLQYVVWMIESIPNLKYKLEEADYQTAVKLIKPLEYLDNKYPHLKDMPSETIIAILVEEGLAKPCKPTSGRYAIHTVYASRYGGEGGYDARLGLEYGYGITQNGISHAMLELIEKYSAKINLGPKGGAGLEDDAIDFR